MSGFAVCSPVFGAAAVRWDRDQSRFDAKLERVPLAKVLGQIRRATGWKVFVEPGSTASVTISFTNLPPREAIPKMVGGLNYALIPRAGGPSRLFIYRTIAEAASDEIQADLSEDGPDAAARIARELIIRLKPDAKTSPEALAKELGAKITGRIDALKAYRLLFDDEAAANDARAALGGNPDVAGVENNFKVDPPDTPTPLTGSGASPFNLNPKVATGCDKTIVGLIDTGIQGLGAAYQPFMLPTVNVASGAPSLSDVPHGTAMAETIMRAIAAAEKQGASSVKVLPVDVYGANETTSTFDVAQGINSAISGGATIINLSLGTTADSPLLHDLIHSITSQGAMVFAAAGNQPVTTPVYPAAYSESTAVTAASGPGQIASYANRGSFVDLMAPGTSYVPYSGSTWSVSGTSPATATASGLAAALASHCTPSAEIGADLKQALPFTPPADGGN